MQRAKHFPCLLLELKWLHIQIPHKNSFHSSTSMPSQKSVVFAWQVMLQQYKNHWPRPLPSAYGMIYWWITMHSVALHTEGYINSFSQWNSLRPWSVVFHCLTSHAPASCIEQLEHDMPGNKKPRTPGLACWYLNERSCYEEFEYWIVSS